MLLQKRWKGEGGRKIALDLGITLTLIFLDLVMFLSFGGVCVPHPKGGRENVLDLEMRGSLLFGNAGTLYQRDQVLNFHFLGKNKIT